MNTILILQRLFHEVFDDETIVLTPKTSRHDIEGWDSVAQVKLVLMIEEEFGLQFDNDEVSSMHTAGDFLQALQSHRSTAV